MAYYYALSNTVSDSRGWLRCSPARWSSKQQTAAAQEAVATAIIIISIVESNYDIILPVSVFFTKTYQPYLISYDIWMLYLWIFWIHGCYGECGRSAAIIISGRRIRASEVSHRL